VIACVLGLSGCASLPLDNAPATGGDASTAAGGAGENAGESAGGDAGAPDAQRIDVLESVHISSDMASDHHQNAEGDVDFGSDTVARATLRLTLESPCFPFEKWATEGVAKGQRWPAPCDAFDRAISVTLDPSDDPAAPAIELMRAITPFGGPLEVDEDITDVFNGLPGNHRLRVMIDTESDPDGLVSGSQGEWLASAALLITPGAAPRRVLAVTPVELDIQKAVDAAPAPFTVPKGAKSARLEYRATGHGQASDPSCIGPAEEFCQRTHTLTLDGDELLKLAPWRDDCDTLCTTTQNTSGEGPTSYCLENPCGDPRSVRAPRANWCPGSRTAPIMIEDARLLVSGDHELGASIAGLKEGGFWRVSATFFAFE
jgi:hypothetical protein